MRIRLVSRSLLALTLATAVLAGCRAKDDAPRAPALPEDEGAPTSKVEAAAPAKDQGLFGDKLTLASVTPLGEVLAAPDRFKSAPLLVEGEVKRACSKKGCWMEVATTKDEGAPSCRVTFKDYGFFMPTTSAGSHAKIEGKLDVTVVPKSRVDHLEAEGAHFTSKNPDGSANEVRLVATGVELSRT